MDEKQRKRLEGAITPKGCGSARSYTPPPPASKLPDWKFWLHMPQVEPWQACALALNIDPDSVMRTDDGMGALGSGTYTFRGFPSDEIGDNFIKWGIQLNAVNRIAIKISKYIQSVALVANQAQ